MKKILVGTDFSPESEVALDQAMNIARHVGSDELILLYAGQIPGDDNDMPESFRVAAAQIGEVTRQQLADDRAHLESLRQRHSGQGVTLSHMVIDSLPAPGITQAAREVAADLVVVGTHGRTGMRRLLLGSVAEKVVREAATDIMVARGTNAGVGGYDKVLVPTDFSDTAASALQTALSLVKSGGEIELFHCWSLPSSSRSWDPIARDALAPLRNEIARHATEEGAALVKQFPREDVKICFNQVEDTPVHGIQEYLEQGKHDLVVVGSHGRRGISRWLLGSVAEGTVRYSPCSVVVVQATHHS